MASKTVSVGCKLPNGIILDHPMDARIKVTLAGAKTKYAGSPIVILSQGDHAVTKVDAEFWESWAAVNKEFPPFKTGAIFVAKDADSVAAIARETLKEKTGFEGMPQNMPGIAPADKAEA